MDKYRPKLIICENVPLAPYTTLGVGGPARFFVEVKNEDRILDATGFARARSCPYFILGSGSNIVVSDTGFPGVVIKMDIPGIKVQGKINDARISVGAGVAWDIFVQYCVTENLAGVECLSGIPGTVGGAPVQNIGAYGEEAGDVILRVRVLDRLSHSITELDNADCQFTYRSSIFNSTHKDRYVILNVEFALRSDGRSRVQYKDLQKHFARSSQLPKISEVRQAVLQIRESKGMILNDSDPDSKSVGSFFKNPVLDLETIAGVESVARERGILGASETIPRFTTPEGHEKLAAAWFIERAGFHKGFALGRAGISGKHALAIINKGGATARDILDLMYKIQERVLELVGIELEPEPVFVGF